MSTAGSPRQRMIGMMYLVLTALLALNVTKEVLDSFIIIDEDLEIINKNTNEKTALLYDKFLQEEKVDPVKVKPFREKADQVKKMSGEMVKNVEAIKEELTKLIGVDEKGMLLSKEDMDKPSQLLIAEKKGEKLKKSILSFKAQLKNIISQVNKDDVSVINLGLNLKDYKEEDGTTLSWENKNFENVPVVAVIAILSSVQTEIKNAETAVANYLYDQINTGTSKVDGFEAKVIAPSSYILAGEKYTADVFLSAFSKSIVPQVLINSDTSDQNKISSGASSVKIEGGMGKFEVSTSQEGLVKWGGKIKMSTPSGMKDFPFHSEFMVAKPSVTISPTKMNVFYTIVENPVSISSPGIPTENLLPPSITNGTISGSRGNYIVKVTEPGKVAKITVRARIGEAVKEVGTMDFRIRKLQNPTAMVASLTGGVISQGSLPMQWGVLVEPGNPDLPIKYNCTGFELGYTRNGTYTQMSPSTSGQFDNAMRAAFRLLKKGDRVFFENIRARDAYNNNVKVNNIYLTIN